MKPRTSFESRSCQAAGRGEPPARPQRWNTSAADEPAARPYQRLSKLSLRNAVGCLAVLLLAGCASMDEKNRTHILIYEQASETMPAHLYSFAELPSTGLKIPINRHPSLTDNDVDDAKLIQTAGGAAIMLRFDPQGMMRLLELTTRCRSRYLVIYLNDKPVAAWLCNKVLDKGQLLIEGDFTDEEAQKAVDSLKKESKKRRAL